MKTIYTKNLASLMIMLAASTMTQAKTMECVTTVELGENFQTKANLFERDVSDTSRKMSLFDLNSLTVTNADTKAKVAKIQFTNSDL